MITFRLRYGTHLRQRKLSKRDPHVSHSIWHCEEDIDVDIEITNVLGTERAEVVFPPTCDRA